MINVKKCYWVRCGDSYGRNFGDEFTKWFVKTKYNIDIEWESAKTAGVAATGSLIEFLPKDYSGMVLGSGSMFNHRTRIPQADIRFVRGPLTAKNLGISNIPYADPALVLASLISPVEKKWDVAYIPHYIDDNLLKKATESNSKVISPTKHSVPEFISLVNQCSSIITSSLHGIITADALGIPRQYVKCDKVVGNEFKFHDYSNSVNQPLSDKMVAVERSTILSMSEIVIDEFDKVYK